MKRHLIGSLAVLTLACSVVLFAGCERQGGSGEGGGTGRAGRAPLVGIAMPETHVQRWQTDGANLRSALERRGYRVEVAFANADQSLQNRQIQTFLTNGARLIIVGNVNEGVASAVSDAARDRVPIIAYDRLIMNSADFEYYITFDNFRVGVFQGQAIADALNLATTTTPRHITLFAGSPTDNNARFFFDGAMSVLNPHIQAGRLVVVGPYPQTSADTANFMRIATENWLAPVAKTRMENLLNADARDVVLDAVLAPNDTLARAIIEALLTDPKYVNNLPVVTGQDAEFASVLSIRNGQQFMTVFKDTNQLADAAAELAHQILSDVPRNVPGTIRATGDLTSIGDTGRRVVTTFLLEPIVIKQNNIHVTVDAGFFSDAEAAQLR